ncbi:putative fluoride ion transporter CrcB [Candidatus Methylobacter favarea]|uniref:Fluoride-specific ion channel FluC n=1 Tax=Candidatus Methylobacter favarea TaxID=2707345 RepID=A0A8S0X9P2_9GAMM|nr:fluoride efflux transporter CrcB [Candidatus Methylobacter favarea]CAA9892516.1 putative fluoride ion transporter CrcB [Candidatus Methylobacter favarea]
MNQLLAVALGGSFGAVVRFLVSSGIYQWLGRGFPYGTLVVNITGSFLIGILTEALILQRIAMTVEYRAAILVGFIGAFTTFSTFSLETVYLIEQGSLTKAALNVVISVAGCILAVWIGLLCGRTLFFYSEGIIQWSGGMFPYALIIVNTIIAFLIGIIATVLLQKVMLSLEYRAAIIVIMISAYLAFSGLYLVLFLIEHGYTFESNWNLMLSIFFGNGLLCLLVIWLGLAAGKQI